MKLIEYIQLQIKHNIYYKLIVFISLINTIDEICSGTIHGVRIYNNDIGNIAISITLIVKSLHI